MIYKPKIVSDFCAQPCIDGNAVVVDMTTGHEVTAAMPQRDAELEAAEFNKIAGWPNSLQTIFGGEE